jgi:inosine/xanthosine triphosphatase
VESAINKLLQGFGNPVKGEIKFFTTKAHTSVPDMPLTQKELMQGALERALFTYKKNEQLDYSIGLEGGVFQAGQNGRAFLQSWVYAFNGKSGYHGSSPALPLPAAIVTALFKENRELSEVIDTISGKEDVRSNEGTFGILTHNLITRSNSFELAVIAAMSPFFNSYFY